MSTPRFKLSRDWDRLEKNLRRAEVLLSTRAFLGIIGSTLLSQTQRRFDVTKTGPDGKAWAPRWPFSKPGGSLMKRTATLRNSVGFQITSDTTGEFGTNYGQTKRGRTIAQVLQEGATIVPVNAKALRIPWFAGSFSKTRTGKTKTLSGVMFRKKVVIPPRPFIGVGEGDVREIIDGLKARFEETFNA